ncbi:MAG: hypothetical protein HY543_01945, partial [Deltaproteobacteria bacterium]|nr:hypothetical protein [Deltaproteobacteria bacterium]
AAFPLPSRPHSWARLDDRHLVFLFDVVSTNVADRSRETRPALGFFRATDRAFGACLLAGDAPGVMLSANLSGQADVQTGDIVLGGSDQIAVLSDVPARFADPAFRWGTLADIGTAMKLCHDVGLQTGPPWQAAAGERIFDVARHADAKGQRDILLVLAGSGPAGKEEIRLIRLAKAEGGLAWNMQATILPPSALPAPQALRIRIEPDEGDAARVLVGTAGVAVRIRCTLDEHAAVQDCAEEKSEVPVFASKGKGWDARLLFFGAGKWKGHAAGALPVEAIGFGMGTFLRRTEKVGHTEIRDIDHHDLLLVATKRAVRLVRVIDGIPVVADREVYPCAGEGCAGQSLPPLPIMTDAKGGMDLAYLAESTLHLLPNRLEAPAARVLVHDRTLMADRVCAYGEECSCTWVLADANGTDLSFLLESPTECVTGIKQSSEAETPDAAVSQVGRIVKSLVLATAHAAMQYKVQLTVSNQDFTTRTTAEMSDGTQNALVINAAAGEMAPRAELQAALVEKGLISSETAVIDLGGKAAVAEQPMTAGGTIGTSTPDATTRDATANGTTVDTATLPAEDSPDGARYAVTDEANPMAGGGACALVAYPYPMRPLTLGFWLIFCLPLAIVWPLRACVVARNRSRRRWRNSQHRSAVSR